MKAAWCVVTGACDAGRVSRVLASTRACPTNASGPTKLKVNAQKHIVYIQYFATALVLINRWVYG